MRTTVKQLDELMGQRENENLEFKEAKNTHKFEDLVKYCAALANERGGKLILGVTDRFPREVVGTTVYRNLERIKADLLRHLHIRIDVCEILHPQGRVIVFDVPSRALGVPVQYEGAY